MNEYKYTIDGKEYKVAIGDIEENVAEVTVNGESFKVEMEPEAEPEKKKVVWVHPQHRLPLKKVLLLPLMSTQPMPLRLLCLA